METVGAFTTRIIENFDGEWSSFGGMCSTEEADFMAQLFVNSSLPDEQPSHESYINNMGGKAEVFPECSSIDINSTSSMSFLSQGSCYSGSGGIHFPPGYQESYYTSYSQPMLMRNDSSITMEHGGMADGEYVIISPSDQVHTNNIIHETSDFFNQDVSNDSIESGENIHEAVLLGKGLQLGRDYEMPELEQSRKNKVECQSEISKKRSRLPGDVPKNKRSVKQKENLKTSEDIDGKTNVLRRQNSMMSCCSENESNVSQDLNGLTSSSNTKMRAGSLNSNGKARASKGSASDPQSMYARKRREKINERLRILQNLVPNGTKVDISTMLEEAVQYVKFLQLQIKLLSSDDHWMYAPIAYNGMDIGLDLNIGIPKSS